MKRKKYPHLERVIPEVLLKLGGFELDAEDYPYGNDTRSRLNQVFKNGNLSSREELGVLLHELGVDTQNYNWYVSPLANRRLSNNEIVNCRAIVGQERIDHDWIQSGYASEEAFFESSEMGDMANVIKRELRGE